MRPLGRRPARLAVPKAELIDAISQLQQLGLGSRVIGRLLGYSHPYIENLSPPVIQRPKPCPELVIMSLLPAPLQAACLNIRIRSAQAYALRDRELPERKAVLPEQL